MIKKLFDKTFLKYFIVGVINTVFGAAIMFIFYNCFHLSYWISSASNYFFGSVLGYFLNKYYTFHCKERNFGVVFRFTATIAVCFFVAYGIAKPLTRYLLSGVNVSVQENGAMLVGLCLFSALNYFGQRFFVFKNIDSPPQDSEQHE